MTEERRQKVLEDALRGISTHDRPHSFPNSVWSRLSVKAKLRWNSIPLRDREATIEDVRVKERAIRKGPALPTATIERLVGDLEGTLMRAYGLNTVEAKVTTDAAYREGRQPELEQGSSSRRTKSPSAASEEGAAEEGLGIRHHQRPELEEDNDRARLRQRIEERTQKEPKEQLGVMKTSAKDKDKLIEAAAHEEEQTTKKTNEEATGGALIKPPTGESSGSAESLTFPTNVIAGPPALYTATAEHSHIGKEPGPSKGDGTNPHERLDLMEFRLKGLTYRVNALDDQVQSLEEDQFDSDCLDEIENRLNK